MEINILSLLFYNIVNYIRININNDDICVVLNFILTYKSSYTKQIFESRDKT